MAKKVILYSLQTFSSTGGIQKMTRTMAHSLYAIAKKDAWDFEFWSAYDNDFDLVEKYLPASNFKGFGLNRVGFVLKTLINAQKPDVIILTHINLALIGLLVKALNPKCQLILIAHGIEVWRPLSALKNKFLKRCNKIVCVSKFTREQVINWHKTDPEKCVILNNAVDPFMPLPVKFSKPDHLLKRYRLSEKNPVIFTLTRLASTEQYKGHEQVIKTVRQLKEKFPNIRYILSGKYDYKEEIRITKLLAEYGVEKEVILTGFLDERELSDHFLLADVFVLPSKKEGFGIVFIEALACGLPVICGDADGSVDAICNGELGQAINADDTDELETALNKHLSNPVSETDRLLLQKKCLQHFNENDYMEKLEKILA